MKGLVFVWFCAIVTLQIVSGGIPREKRILLSDPETIDARFHQMEIKIQSLVTDAVERDNKITALTESMKKKDEQILNLTNTVLKGVVTNPIAFTAILNHNQALGAGQTLRYNNVLTNAGNAYDPSTGIFEAPVSGIYSLSVSLMGEVNTPIHLLLEKNGKELVRLWTQGGGHELASHTINVALRQHDRIWVQSSDVAKLYGAENFNLFSAALLYEGIF